MSELPPPPYEKLKEIRQRTDLEARIPTYLRDAVEGLDGRSRPINLRYYQIQGIMHLLAMKRFLLGDDTGLGKCCVPSTFVQTDAGLLRIGALNPGNLAPDTFSSVSGRAVSIGGNVYSIRRFYYGGEKPTLKIRTRYHYGVEGTLVHPLRVRTSEGREVWKQLADLQIGEYLCVDRQAGAFSTVEPELPAPDLSGAGVNLKRYTLPRQMTPELARLLGYIVGEAWSGGEYTLPIAQHRDVNPESHDDIRDLVQGLFGHHGGSSNTAVVISSKEIRAYLAGLGVDYVLSREKSVPWPIFRSTRASVAQFLRGIFEAEAWVGPANMEFSSASERLAEEVQMLLLQFGIVAKRKSGQVKGYDHTYWTVTVSGEGLRIFRREIGLVTTRKKAGLEMYPAHQNPNHDVVPFARDATVALYQCVAAKVAVTGANASRRGSGMKPFSGRLSGYQFIKSGRSDPSYFFLQRLLDLSKEIGTSSTPEHREVEALVARRFFYDPVVSIEPGHSEVMDIEVDSAEHAYVAGGVVSHNTCQTIAALCYLWEKTPNLRVIILTSKSAVNQWASEFVKFTRPGLIKTFVCAGSPVKRQKQREVFLATEGPAVLVMGYRTAVSDFSALQDLEGYILVTDEASAYKNHQTQVHQVVHHLAQRAERLWALTATLIKNNLVEGWGIYRVVVPGLFGTHTNFLNEFCITRMQTLPGTRRQVPVITGYRQRDIALFRERIDPYFLGRPKFEVARELPPLVVRHVKCEMTRFQAEKYKEALSGLLEVGVRTETGARMAEEREVSKLTAVSYCQQIVNHPELIGCEGDSDKLDTLLDTLTEGELADEKVIVFTRFSKMVDLLMPILAKAKIKAVRITGAEDEKKRKAAQDAFQDSKGDTRVIVITTAASEAINLQAAKALIFYDTPWSAGEYLQIIGRMIRIGSTHDRCFALHLVCTGTIDVRVTQVLAKKMDLVEQVLGRRLKGEDDDVVVNSSDDLTDLFEGLMEDARAASKS